MSFYWPGLPNGRYQKTPPAKPAPAKPKRPKRYVPVIYPPPPPNPSAATSPIWLLSTRGRPELCQQVLDATHEMGMRSPGVVYIDGGEPYELALPDNWTVHHEQQWRGLGASMQWCFQKYPLASRYGWLADDTLPRTRSFDTHLEDAAGNWYVSYARDLWLSEMGTNFELAVNGYDLTSGLCFGGELVRTVGWWAPTGLFEAGIDLAWCSLINKDQLNLCRYLHGVTVEHMSWRSGKRPLDETDNYTHERGLTAEALADINREGEWEVSQEWHEIIERVRRRASRS